MHDHRRSARRTTAPRPGRAKAIGALVVVLAGAALALWTLRSADAVSPIETRSIAQAPPVEPPPLSQPNWYYTQEESPPEPVAVPGLSQPNFITFPGMTVETPPAVTQEKPIEAPPTVTQPFAANSAAVATTSQASSRWSTLWRQVLGKSTAPPPNTSPSVASTNPPLPRPAARTEAASPGWSPQGPVVAEWISPQFGGDLVQQAIGMTPQPAATPATGAAVADNRHVEPLTPATRPPDEVVVPRAVAGLWQQTIGDNPPSATVNNPTPPATVSNPTPSQREAGPTSITIPIPPMTIAGAASNATAPVPAPTAKPSNGDPILNKVADAFDAVSGAKAQEDLASLFRPLVVGPNTPQPVQAKAPTAARTAPAPQKAGLDGSILLQPFQMTNANPNSTTRGPNGTASAANQTKPRPGEPDPLENVWRGSLVRQFTMTTGEDLRKPSPVGTAIAAEQKSWDGGWTFYLPEVENLFTATNDPTLARPAASSNAELVAFLQDATLEPTPQPEPADLDAKTGETVQRGGNAAGGPAQGDSLAGAEKLGTAPDDNTLEFLRAQTVLLEPGESQCDVGVNYLLTENDFPVLISDGVNIVGVSDARFRVRQLSVPIEYRTGLTKRVQGFIGAPVGWSNTQIALGQFEDHRNDGGLGDIDFGVTMQLREATADTPYWVATLSGTAPTGGDPFTGVLGLAPSAPSLGQGFWSISGSVLFIQPYDPVVVFYGLAMERFFDHEYIGQEFEPGAQYSYSLGVGFAVNDRITLSSRFRGTYQEELEVNGVRVIGTNAEPMSLRFSATISKPCDRVVEPFVEFGLTDDSTSAFFGVTWTFSPGYQADKDKKANGKKDGDKI